jgi:hypothetical protein
MLYQLSYSPNELDNLEAFFEGYTSAVRDEADVYLKRANVARGQRKKALRAFFGPAFPSDRKVSRRTARRRPLIPKQAAGATSEHQRLAAPE